MLVADAPIWEIMALEGRRYGWLAGRIGYSFEHVSRVKAGIHPATPEFRRRCAEALGRPESELFHPTPNGQTPNGDTANSHETLTAVGE